MVDVRSLLTRLAASLLYPPGYRYFVECERKFCDVQKAIVRGENVPQNLKARVNRISNATVLSFTDVCSILGNHAYGGGRVTDKLEELEALYLPSED